MLTDDSATQGWVYRDAQLQVQGGTMSKKKKREAPGLVEQLKEAIRQSGQSLNQLSRASGVGSNQLSRFMRGERTLTLPSAEKICRVLHLQLLQEPTPPQPTAEDE